MISKAHSFEFTSYNFDLEERKASFKYSVVLNDEKKVQFTETLFFPTEFLVDTIQHDLLYACLYDVHLILGISYWKIYCPASIIIATAPLSEGQANFWKGVYCKGLGEFFYKNSINFHKLIHFPYSPEAQVESYSTKIPDKSLVGVGGGKDSIVAIEELKKAGKKITGFILHSGKKSHLAADVTRLANISTIIVERTLDPQIFELNKSKDIYNGHIPISAIYAFVGVLTAALYGYASVVVANEKSANIGNVKYLDEEINHQWSKSEEFEKSFQNYVRIFITPSISYYSALRQFSELQVVEKFTHYKKYFSTFSSCNRNFAITKTTQSKWCGECPKCAFVFASLSAFLPKHEVLSIFNQDLFSNPQLTNLYKQLTGLEDIKPFECVGTFEETKLALFLAYQKKEFEGSVIITLFEKEILPTIGDIEKLRADILPSK